MLMGLVVLVAGGVLMATEVVAFRVIGRIFGSALRETTAVIAMFLAAMSTGYVIGGRVGDQRPGRGPIALALGLAAAWLAILPAFQVTVGDRVAASSLPLGLHALATTALLFFVPVALLASVYPASIRLVVRDVTMSGRVAGGLSAASAVGSIIGTLATGFWLLGAFSISTILRALAFVLGVAALVALRRAPRVAASSIALVLIIAGHAAAAGVIYTRDSAYHHIRVEDAPPYRVLHFDDTDQSRMLLSEPTEGGYEYTAFFHTVWLYTEPRSVLFIGLGGGTGPKQFLHDYPNVEIEAAEVDPAVVKVAKEYFGVPDDPRLQIHTQDGRVFLRRTNERFDAVLVDAYNSGRYGSSIPFQVTTREFFELVRDHLSDDGVLVYNVIERARSHDSQFLRALSKTIALVFPEQALFECETSDNTVLVAMKRPRGMDGAALLDRARKLVESGVVRRSDFVDSAASLVISPLDVATSPVLTDDYAPVDQLLER